jgi:hypothetical protein
MDAHRFQHPGPAYRGVALWMLNDRLDPDEIAVTLTGTPRNLLGPRRRPQGEPDQCWTWDYLCAPEWLEDKATLDAHWTDDYVLLRFGHPPGAHVRYASIDPCADADRE